MPTPLPIRRIRSLMRQNGPWALQMMFGLLVNRAKLVIWRVLLQEPSIYFQSAPRILGRRGIVFGARFTCGRGAWIEALTDDRHGGAPKLWIGNDVAASDHFHVAAARSVTIGDHVLIGSGVLITDHGHGSYGENGDRPTQPPNQRPLHVKGPVLIGNRVWLGDGVRVLSGVSIGDNAVIAANTVVRENVPENSVFGSSAAGTVYRIYDTASSRWTSAGLRP